MQFEVNDKIELIDEPVKGYITAIRGDWIRFCTEEGFEMEVHHNEVVRAAANTVLNISHEELSKVLKEKGDIVNQKQQHTISKALSNAVVEVDLHIHHLTDSTKGMTNYEMLCLQVETARKRLETAMRNRTQKLVFIHGVGAGVLKSALEDLFSKYTNISYNDADFKRYGFGATEVYIYRARL